MAVPTKKIREIIFQMLYSHDMGFAENEDIIQLVKKELSVSNTNMQLANEQLQEIIKHLVEIDPLIKSTSESYAFERIQRAEKNILRLGVFELIYSEIPPKIVIAEGIRLARKFSTPESANFINAILDAIYKSRIGEEVDKDQITEASKALEESEKID